MKLAEFPASQLGFDEVRRAAAASEWQWLERSLESYTASELEARWQDLARSRRDSSPHWGPRHWELDPLPAVLPESDWQQLEHGLIQRAELLNEIQEDVYGQQLLLREGLLPAPLLYANRLWLQPCLGLVDSDMSRLMFYAVDVARDAEGRWWVMRDRTQCPAGFGAVLENRRWMARTYSELFGAHQIQPVAPVYHALRQGLQELGQRGESGRAVMLTPAAGSPHGADAANLAQFLGCALVEGEDLSVRGSTLYLKLLEGLQPVDLVLRRIPDAACDPLELAGSGWEGPVGLLQAVRAGNVVVSNSVGSGWLESPALAAELPRLCRELRGEELLLPSLPSHWRLPFPAEGEWVARAFSGGPPLLRRPADLGQHPYSWVLQQHLSLSEFPSLVSGRPEMVAGSVRCFLVHTGSGYRLVPGGLVRLKPRIHGKIYCKDLWRLPLPSEESGAPSGRTPVSLPLELSRLGGDVPSRVASDFFWFGRYLERCESLLRFARVLLQRQTQENDAEGRSDLERVLACREEMRGGLRAWVQGHEDDQLQALLKNLQRLGGCLRDRLSADVPRILAALQSAVPCGGGEPARLAYLEALSVPIWALTAVARESLYRGYGFRFLEIGRRLERATQTLELLRALGRSPAPRGVLEVLLEVTDSGRTYRRRYPAALEWLPALDMLLADETHPRSVAFQLRSLEDHFAHLPQRNPVGLASHQRALLLTRDRLKLWQPPEPAPLEWLAEHLPAISQGLTSVYLTHVRPSFQGDSRAL